MKFETEWGSFDVVTARDTLHMVSEQLRYYLKNNTSPNPQYTRECLECYEKLAEMDDDAIDKFFKERREGKDILKAFNAIYVGKDEYFRATYEKAEE